MRISAKGLLSALFLTLLIPAHAFENVPIGLLDGIDLPESPFDIDFMAGRAVTFNVKKGNGDLTGSGTYIAQFTDEKIFSLKGKAQVRDLSSRTWDFQIPYKSLPSVRVGDYVFKMKAPLSGVFSNVLFATTNVPPVVVGTQAGTFSMAERRFDMSKDFNPEIVWQRDDGHLGVWFMGNAINGTATTIDTNLNKGIYFDSLYAATGHQDYDPNWRLIGQSDLDLNGMQDWIWQNTNSGQMRAWYLANTNFVDPSLSSYNYHDYSVPIVSTSLDSRDYTVTTNLTPTLVTNIFPIVAEQVYTNFLSGPALVITSVTGTNVTTTNLLFSLYTTNTYSTTITSVTSTTNNNNQTIYLTNIIVVTTNSITTNSYLDFTLTNVTSVEVSGRTEKITNVLVIPNLLDFGSTEIVVPNVGGSDITLTNTYTHVTFDNVYQYFTNRTVTFYADIVPGYYLVTFTTNYNVITTTNFFNPFVREVALTQQSPPDAGTRFIGCADLNNDGFPDYLYRAADGSIFFVSYSETFDVGVSNPNRYLSGPGNQGWCVAGIIDLNSDGWPDLLWQNNKTGATAIWFMQGVSDPDLGYQYKHIKNGSLNGGAAMPTWKISGNADFNHDGQMDVLLRNTKTGQLIFWYLNGARTIKSSTISGPVLPWQIVGPK
ncbi:MAG: multicopper oxidase, type 2 [Verrucomicrobiales bacterium]|nr:multicopper oxidase, type 2 [Verrucomicrobiales bacterium]